MAIKKNKIKVGQLLKVVKHRHIHANKLFPALYCSSQKDRNTAFIFTRSEVGEPRAAQLLLQFEAKLREFLTASLIYRWLTL